MEKTTKPKKKAHYAFVKMAKAKWGPKGDIVVILDEKSEDGRAKAVVLPRKYFLKMADTYLISGSSQSGVLV